MQKATFFILLITVLVVQADDSPTDADVQHLKESGQKIIATAMQARERVMSKLRKRIEQYLAKDKLGEKIHAVLLIRKFGKICLQYGFAF
ncbi:unnamed protein product [Dicrocoelium dendriticum]|nr:unnamed protein product [Dicrocoelium dendriticum]